MWKLRILILQHSQKQTLKSHSLFQPKDFTGGCPPIILLCCTTQLEIKLVNNSSNPNNIHLLEVIGRGTYSVVHKAVWRGSIVAAKQIDIYLPQQACVALPRKSMHFSKFLHVDQSCSPFVKCHFTECVVFSILQSIQ